MAHQDVKEFLRSSLSETPVGGFIFRAQMGEAATEVNRSGSLFCVGEGISVGTFAVDPDTEIVAEWLASIGRPVSELGVLYWFSVSARSEWKHLPKRTLVEHRKLYERVDVLAAQLVKALEETVVVYWGDGWGSMNPSVVELFTQSERCFFESMMAPDEGFYSPEARAAWPRVGELLERLRIEAGRLSEKGPMHMQPGKHGAERGYFIRRIGQLLQQRYGAKPHEVIAVLTTVALGETTQRELVRKLLP